MFVLSSLSGFTNVFKDEKLEVKTTILIFNEENQDYDFLTSQGNFFEPKDYDLADILIDGIFDGNGNYKGTLKFYDESIDYSYTNPRKKNSRNFYGSFPIKLGYSLLFYFLDFLLGFSSLSSRFFRFLFASGKFCFSDFVLFDLYIPVQFFFLIAF